MNNWLVIEYDGNFIALTSDQWNETPEYVESWIIRSGLTMTSSLKLVTYLNDAIEKWEKYKTNVRTPKPSNIVSLREFLDNE